MKTIFRYTNIGLILAVIIAFGAVAGLAQNPCEDADGQLAASTKVTELFKDKTIDGRKKFVDAGKQFLEKYGACEAPKELLDWLKLTIPKIEKIIIDMTADLAKKALLDRFDKALLNKNWDELYASGKEILDKYPGDDYRAVELALGSVGLDETAKTPRVTKWNEDTLKYAKLSIADLEAGKVFKSYGISMKGGANFEYKDKDDALGWMYYIIGYIIYFDKANKKDSLPYLYKATQITSGAKSKPIIYSSIGSYYFDEVRRLGAEVDAMIKLQDDKDTPEVAKQKVEAIKAKVAIFNGTAEAAMDAYARAYNLAKAPDSQMAKTYTDGLNKNLQDLYNVRFTKMDGFDTYIANTVKKPMPNPTLPVTPISDPEPAPSTTTTTSTPAVKPPATTPVKPGTTIKPVTSPGAKPGTASPAKSVGSGKPEAVVKKPVAKKKAA